MASKTNGFVGFQKKKGEFLKWILIAGAQAPSAGTKYKIKKNKTYFQYFKRLGK